MVSSVFSKFFCLPFCTKILFPNIRCQTSGAQVHKLPQSHCGHNREGTLFSWLHIYYANHASVKFEHSVCQRFFLTTIYGDFGQVKRRINQLVSPGDFFRVETLQDSEIFRIVFLDVIIFNVIYYHDGVLSSFGVDSIPTVIKICISTIFWIKYDAYGTYLLRHH